MARILIIYRENLVRVRNTVTGCLATAGEARLAAQE